MIFSNFHFSHPSEEEIQLVKEIALNNSLDLDGREMWILKYLGCLIHGHSFIGIIRQGFDYHHYQQYCLHCGKTQGGILS